MKRGLKDTLIISKDKYEEFTLVSDQDKIILLYSSQKDTAEHTRCEYFCHHFDLLALRF